MPSAWAQRCSLVIDSRVAAFWFLETRILPSACLLGSHARSLAVLQCPSPCTDNRFAFPKMQMMSPDVPALRPGQTPNDIASLCRRRGSRALDSPSQHKALEPGGPHGATSHKCPNSLTVKQFQDTSCHRYLWNGTIWLQCHEEKDGRDLNLEHGMCR